MSKAIIEHSVASETFNKDEPYVDWHDETLWFVRQKRDKSSKLLPEWEPLREVASGL
jgi:L-lactate dehydrogenase complex protein LldF